MQVATLSDVEHAGFAQELEELALARNWDQWQRVKLAYGDWLEDQGSPYTDMVRGVWDCRKVARTKGGGRLEWWTLGVQYFWTGSLPLPFNKMLDPGVVNSTAFLHFAVGALKVKTPIFSPYQPEIYIAFTYQTPGRKGFCWRDVGADPGGLPALYAHLQRVPARAA